MSEKTSSNVFLFHTGPTRRVRGPVDGGPGGPHDSDMEARVSKLEGVCEDIRDVLRKLEPSISKMSADMSEIKGKVSQMPTAFQMFGTMLTGIVAVFGLAFALMKLVGAGH